MSEYQYLAFRAVDRPLTEKELQFAHNQSTRAEITKWRFENEYNWSGFRGDRDGLLRHGYDVHLHYANYGIRTIGLRLPSGLPFSDELSEQYVRQEGICLQQDKNRNSMTLWLEPFHDAGSIDEYFESLGEVIDELVVLRNRLVEGDLRMLYLLWLFGASGDYADPEEIEPPIPAGLDELGDIFDCLMDFYGLDPLIIKAAAESSQPTPKVADRDLQIEKWVKTLSKQELAETVSRFLAGEAAVQQAELLAKVRGSQKIEGWPTANGTRTLNDLFGKTYELRTAKNASIAKQRAAAEQRAAQKLEQQRQARMRKMAESPEPWIKKADELVAARGTANYQAAAQILAELRDALGPPAAKKIRHHAAHLTKEHPTLNRLKSALRKQDLLD